MVQTANGLFIWAATACRFVREGQRFAAKRLDIILKGSGSIITTPEKHLNEIYITVLSVSESDTVVITALNRPYCTTSSKYHTTEKLQRCKEVLQQCEYSVKVRKPH